MYRNIRNLHLLASAFTLAFLLVYAVSSVAMAHNTWVDARPAVTETRVALAPGLGMRAAVLELLRRGEINGEIRQLQPARANVVTLGVMQAVGYDPETGQASLRISRFGFWGLLNRLHHLSGFWHEQWLLNLWSAFLLATSAGLLMLGGTGIYLWYRTRGVRVLGSVFLALGLGGGFTLLALMRQ